MKTFNAWPLSGKVRMSIFLAPSLVIYDTRLTLLIFFRTKHIENHIVSIETFFLIVVNPMAPRKLHQSLCWPVNQETIKAY